MYIYGRIKNGIIEVQRFFKPDLLKNEGKSVEIKIEENSRTQQQNRYMWGVVYKIVSQETGYTVNEVHEVFKQKFLTYTKKGHKFTKSTTELSTKEFGEYLDQVINYAQSELGYIIPDPEIEFED